MINRRHPLPFSLSLQFLNLSLLLSPSTQSPLLPLLHYHGNHKVPWPIETLCLPPPPESRCSSSPPDLPETPCSSSPPPLDSPPAPPEMSDNLIPIPAIIILLSVFIYISSYFFYNELRRLSGGGSEAAESERRGQGDAAGLDPAVLASFPVAPYAAVRGVTEGKGGTECPVCLTEFASGDEVRVLTVCCHAFHPACIDPWLAGNATCPVCRSDLGAQPDDEKLRTVMEAAGDGHVISTGQEGVSNSEPERSGVVERRREGEDEGTRR